MTVAANAAEERLRRRLQQQAARCTGRALRIYTPALRDYLRRSQPPDVVDSFISVLRNAVDRVVNNHNELLEYAQALVELLANIGGGSQFRGKEELLDVFERVAGELFDAGCATADLRLIMARYCSAISNGGDRRLRLIKRALRESRTEDERLRALLVMAKYHIDISDYDRAHRYLDDCLAVADRAGTGAAQRYDINTTRGIAYYYRDHTLATRYFLRGIALDQTIIDPVICRSTASALHHLGRIKAASGDHKTGVVLIVLAQCYKDQMIREGTQFGYYHLRLGEILAHVGNIEQGMWHLEQASRVFQGVRERSNAEAHLNGALASLAAGHGDHRKAVRLLTAAISTARDDRYPRGELLFRYQLAHLHLRRGSLVAALTTALPGIRAMRAARLGGS